MIDKIVYGWVLMSAIFAYLPSPTVKELERVKFTPPGYTIIPRLEPLPTIAGYIGMTYYLSKYLAHNACAAISFSAYAGAMGHTLDETILRRHVQADVYGQIYHLMPQLNGFLDPLAYNIQKTRTDHMNESGKCAQQHMLISILLVPLLYLHIQQIIQLSGVMKEKLRKKINQQDSGVSDTTNLAQGINT
jgi:hypothetical protein